MNMKRMKNAVMKMNMPEDMKQRLIENCEAAAEIRKNADVYTEHVSGVERISRRRNIVRTVSGLAACAVIAGGIGTAVHIAGSGSKTGSMSQATEAEAIVTPDVTAVQFTEAATLPETEPAAAVTPFGDFFENDFRLSSRYLPGDYDWDHPTEIYMDEDSMLHVTRGEVLTQEQKTALANYFNSLEYEECAGSVEETGLYEGAYTLGFINDYEWCAIIITPDNYLKYWCCPYEMDENGYAHTHVDVQFQCYTIDYEATAAIINNVVPPEPDVLTEGEYSDTLPFFDIVPDLKTYAFGNTIVTDEQNSAQIQSVLESLDWDKAYTESELAPGDAEPGYEIVFSIIFPLEGTEGQLMRNLIICKNGFAYWFDFTDTVYYYKNYHAYMFSDTGFLNELKSITG